METGVIRLIDADALKRDLIDNWAFYSVLLKNAIERQPTIDAVEVVRCKDCSYCAEHPTSDTVKICKNEKWNDEFYPLVHDNDFCSYGERREENAAD